jgi:glutathione S-transferase
MNKKIRIVGSYLSPYVRKVLVCLHIKRVPYEIDPIVPFYGDEKFTVVSPLRRVPVFIDGDMTLADSTVICEYLEEKYPSSRLFPSEAPCWVRFSFGITSISSSYAALFGKRRRTRPW